MPRNWQGVGEEGLRGKHYKEMSENSGIMDMFIILIVEVVTQMSKRFTSYILNNIKTYWYLKKIQMYHLKKDKISKQFRKPKS